MTTATTLDMPLEEAPARRDRPGLVARWREAWSHALAAYYRAQVATPSPGMGALGVLLTWGLFLLGTGLTVWAYPTATGVRCDGYGACQYPLQAFGDYLDELADNTHLILFLPLAAGLFNNWSDLFSPARDTLKQERDRLLARYLARAGQNAADLPKPARWQRLWWGELAGLDGADRQAYRKDLVHLLQPLRRQEALIKNSWANGMVALIAITPLGAGGLVRVRFLFRLHKLWQCRAWTAMGFVPMALATVGYQIVMPPLWWLGRWRQWAVLLSLTLAWAAVLVVWQVAFAALATLREFAARPGRFSLLGWSMVPVVLVAGFGVALLTVALPAFLIYELSVPMRLDLAVLSMFALPFGVLGIGLVFGAACYGAAQIVFSLRLRTYELPG